MTLMTNIQPILISMLGVGAPLPLDLSVKYAIAHIHLGHDSIVQTFLQPLLEQKDISRFSDLYFEVGEAYLGTGKFERALTMFDAIQHVPEFDAPALWTRQAHCLRLLSSSQHNISRAEQLYQKILALDPTNIEVQLGLSALYERAGNRDRALEVIGGKDASGVAGREGADQGKDVHGVKEMIDNNAVISNFEQLKYVQQRET